MMRSQFFFFFFFLFSSKKNLITSLCCIFVLIVSTVVQVKVEGLLMISDCSSDNLVETKKISGSSSDNLVVIKKLFVFGDSYADTGNIPKSLNPDSWKSPYGITFPGKPSGRFSDGRVLTDYVAEFLGLRSPIPYSARKWAGWKVKYGMNFAFGKTGVFDTNTNTASNKFPNNKFPNLKLPNMTTQIDYFQQIYTNTGTGTISSKDLGQSVAFISLAGNDYSSYLTRGGSLQGLQELIGQVVNQVSLNMKRIHSLGVRKVMVSALEPIGCLPRNTGSVNTTTTSSSRVLVCNSSINLLVRRHNQLLRQQVANMNNNNNYYSNPRTSNNTSTSSVSPFFVLDLFSAFTTVLQSNTITTTKASGFIRSFEDPLRPCCTGINGCASHDGNTKLVVCEDPTSKFFWDSVHPTQAGWEAVYPLLKHTLHQFYF